MTSTGTGPDPGRDTGTAGEPATDETDPPAIRLEDVYLSYGDQTVLDGVTLELARGGTLCVLGGSGAGKSTILRLVLCLDRCDHGRVYIHGKELDEVSEAEEREILRDIGMVFQASALFDSLSVFDNVAFPLYEYGDVQDEAVIRSRVHEVLHFVDLDPDQVDDQLPSQLSGGMKKRVAVARAIVSRPNILLFDEPTSGLDPITTRRISSLIRKLQREMGVSSMVVTHDIATAFQVANRLALLYEGRVVFEGTPEEMKASEDPYVCEFLGMRSSGRDVTPPGGEELAAVEAERTPAGEGKSENAADRREQT